MEGVVRTLCFFWLLVQFPSVVADDCPALSNSTVQPLDTKHPCIRHSEDCSRWMVSAVLFTFNSHSNDTYLNTWNFLKESLGYCSSTSIISVFEIGNSNGSVPLGNNTPQYWCNMIDNNYFTDEYIRINGNSSQQIDSLVHLLNYANLHSSYTTSPPNGNYKLYIFTDLTCIELCNYDAALSEAIYNFILKMSKKNYDVKMFTYEPLSLYTACSSFLSEANLNITEVHAFQEDDRLCIYDNLVSTTTFVDTCPALMNATIKPLSTDRSCVQSPSNNCSMWKVTSVIFSFNYHSNDTYLNTMNFMRKSLSNCSPSTYISVFDIGNINDNSSVPGGPNTPSYWNEMEYDNYFTNENILIDGTQSQQIGSLLRLINYVILHTSIIDTSKDENGFFYMFTDVSCQDLCTYNTNLSGDIYKLIFLMAAKNYNINIFTYNSLVSYYDCSTFLSAANIRIWEMPANASDQYPVCPNVYQATPVSGYDETTTEVVGKQIPFDTLRLVFDENYEYAVLGTNFAPSTTATKPTTTKKPLPGGTGLSDAELAMIIGIPCLSFLLCCCICACVCIKCTTARAKAMNNFKKWKYGESYKTPQTMEECAIEIEYQKRMGKLPHLENFATANLYMDIKMMSDKNKKDYWELPPKQLLIHETEILGSGAFANVFKGTLTGKIPLLKAQSSMSVTLENRKEGSVEVAVKRLPPHADEQNKLDFFHEMQFMKRLGYHVHVISMLGCVSEPEDPLILVEYCQHGDLLHFLRANRQDIRNNDIDKLLSVKNLVSIAWQISDGLAYLHANHFVHRDIAARNILLTNNLVAKISDFGLCRYIDSALYTAKGGKLPIKWMAIESLKFYEYSSKTDVWAYAYCIWEVFSLGDGPFQGVQPLDMLKYIEDSNRLPQTEKCPNEVYQLLLDTWKLSSTERPEINEIRAKFMAMLNMDDVHYGYLDCPSKADIPPLYVEGFGIQQRRLEISQENKNGTHDADEGMQRL